MVHENNGFYINYSDIKSPVYPFIGTRRHRSEDLQSKFYFAEFLFIAKASSYV
jgi:hypothetical protein